MLFIAMTCCTFCTNGLPVRFNKSSLAFPGVALVGEPSRLLDCGVVVAVANGLVDGGGGCDIVLGTVMAPFSFNFCSCKAK